MGILMDQFEICTAQLSSRDAVDSLLPFSVPLASFIARNRSIPPPPADLF